MQPSDLVAECERLSDADLIRELRFLSDRDRRGVARQIAHLREAEKRRLYRKGEKTAGDLFSYCTRVLGYDEFDAYRRVKAAKLAVARPEVIGLLDSGRIALSTLAVVSKVITEANAAFWISEAQGKSRRQIEALIVAHHPEQARADMVRRLPMSAAIIEAISTPAPGPAPQAETPASREGDAPVRPPAAGEWPKLEEPPGRLPVGMQMFVPLAVNRVRVAFDASGAIAGMIARARQILRHKHPEGRLEDVIHEALSVFLDRRDPQRRLALKKVEAAALEAPAPEPPRKEAADRLDSRFMRAWQSGRYVPASVKSRVWQRDGGRCSWRMPDGSVCGSRDWLEYDHIRPIAKGGRSDQARNIRLLCREHNLDAARAAGLRIPGDPPPDVSAAREARA